MRVHNIAARMDVMYREVHVRLSVRNEWAIKKEEQQELGVKWMEESEDELRERERPYL